MAVGKNKRLTKGKKGGKKKIVDPFTKKEWYKVNYLCSRDPQSQHKFSDQSPICFQEQKHWSNFGYPISRYQVGCWWSQRTCLRGQPSRSSRWRIHLQKIQVTSHQYVHDFFITCKSRLVCEEVQGDNCLTNFHGMELTRDKQCSIIKKWQSKIEAHVDCTTTDGYKLRLFCVGFTKRRQNQVKKTTYAQTTQIRAIRKKMMDIMKREVSIKVTEQYFLAKMYIYKIF